MHLLQWHDSYQLVSNGSFSYPNFTWILLFLDRKFDWHHLQLDSLEKLDTLLDACQKIGVETKPGIIDDLGIIPLYSWYHEVSVLETLLCDGCCWNSNVLSHIFSSEL